MYLNASENSVQSIHAIRYRIHCVVIRQEVIITSSTFFCLTRVLAAKQHTTLEQRITFPAISIQSASNKTSS